MNCYYDQSAPQRIAARVKSKYRDSSGKQMSTYQLELEPWGPQTERSFVEVGPGTYQRTGEGQQIEVKLRRGDPEPALVLRRRAVTTFFQLAEKV